MTTTRADRPIEPGDLILVELGPVRGTEQDGRRPALVVSFAEMHTLTKRAVICPVTSNLDPWPTKVFLPEGLGVRGAVLTDQIRSIDRQNRILRRIGSVPSAVLADVRHQLALILGLRTE
ncbi:UNVERIFIED_CONTAM: type II toxin-antitoxin system PemK/MazF family toxin [Methylobacteriaceae bacterium AG10]|nr:type II toxin-antitoxin system PemK/MazF family toxin [Methylobacteriaceae bacterium AG10]